MNDAASPAIRSLCAVEPGNHARMKVVRQAILRKRSDMVDEPSEVGVRRNSFTNIKVLIIDQAPKHCGHYTLQVGGIERQATKRPQQFNIKHFEVVTLVSIGLVWEV